MIKLEPIKLSDGGMHILLKIVVDKQELRFVLDTGASHSVMDIEWAKNNLSEDEINRMDDPAQGIGSSVEVHKAIVSEIKIGELELKDKTIALIDFSAINSIYAKEGLEEVQGILGGDILFDYSAIIDYAKMELTFQAIDVK